MLYILRHGQSLWNSENRFTGWEDIDLNDVGVNEANNVGQIFENLNIDIKHIFTSKLCRAINTAKIIKKHIKSQTNIPIETQLLNERNYGCFTGLNKNDIKEKHGKDFLHNLRRSYDNRPDGGESLRDVVARVEGFCKLFLDKIIKENVLIVAHGNSLRALFVHLGLKNESNINMFEIPTCQLIQIDLEKMEYKFINKYSFSGRQILDSRGNPTVEVLCKKSYGRIIGRGSSPSGASCGSKEAYELRDGNKSLFNGKSVLDAIQKVSFINSRLALKESSFFDLASFDEQLILLDNTTNKTNLGGNTTTALSFCAFDTITNLMEIDKFHYIKAMSCNPNKLFIPTPFANILNGGKHGSGGLKIQEFMIFPNEKYDINKQIQIIYDIFYQLKKLLLSKYGNSSVNFGDEGGYVPCGITTNFQALDILQESITNSNLIAGKDVFVALDCAASEFYDSKTSLYEIEENMYLTGLELISYYKTMIEKYPFIKSIEDPFDEVDYTSWTMFTNHCSHIVNVVGDDLFCSNIKLVEQGLHNGWANSLLLKVNQIGTITESVASAKLMLDKNKKVIVSHRSGETNHSMIIDLAVGLGAQYVKIGGLCRGERIEKYNRLLEINDLIN
jgi:enolase